MKKNETSGLYNIIQIWTKTAQNRAKTDKTGQKRAQNPLLLLLTIIIIIIKYESEPVFGGFRLAAKNLKIAASPVPKICIFTLWGAYAQPEAQK